MFHFYLRIANHLDPTRTPAARLPRFRLFGDTMNTAARMMQKGLPGEVGETSWEFSCNRPRKKNLYG